ncbi:MAG: hypothetical protein ABIG42_03630 [bacterium]
MRFFNIFFFVILINALVYVESAVADPLDKFMKPLPGAGEIMDLPGFYFVFPKDDTNELTITWTDSCTFRYKLDGLLEDLLTSGGPVINYRHANKNAYYEIGWFLHDTEFLFVSGDRINQLDGDRNLLKVETAFLIPMKNAELTIGGRYSYHNLEISGKLPILFKGVPGLGEDENSFLKWKENEILVASHYRKGKDSVGLMLGFPLKNISLESVSSNERARLEFKPSGFKTGLSLSTEVDNDITGELYFALGRLSGKNGVFRQDEQIGPMHTGINNRQWCIRLFDTAEYPDWMLSLIYEKSSTGLQGSADLTQLANPIYGIASPRAHLNAHYDISQTMLKFEKELGKFLNSDLSGSFGLTYWAMNGKLTTWESLLFGSAIINENTEFLDVESGLLFHLGFNADWQLSQKDSIRFDISQSIPFNVKRQFDQPGGISQPHDRKWDGGRFISLSFVHSF